MSKSCGRIRELPSIAHDGLTALELFERESDAALIERLQSALDAGLAHQSPDVTQLAPRGPEQGQVRAAGTTVDPLFDQAKKILLAVLDPVRERRPGFVDGDPLPQEPRQAPHRTARTSVRR